MTAKGGLVLCYVAHDPVTGQVRERRYRQREAEPAITAPPVEHVKRGVRAERAAKVEQPALL